MCLWHGLSLYLDGYIVGSEVVRISPSQPQGVRHALPAGSLPAVRAALCAGAGVDGVRRRQPDRRYEGCFQLVDEGGASAVAHVLRLELNSGTPDRARCAGERIRLGRPAM